MLNRERIVKTYNRVNGKRISPDNSEVVIGIMGLDEVNLPEEAIIKAIESGAVTSKQLLLDARYMAAVISEMDMDNEQVRFPEVEEVEVVEETPKPPTLPQSGQGILEQAIFGVVNDAVVGMVEPKLDALFDDYCKRNPSKIQAVVEYVNPANGNTTEGVQHEKFGEIATMLKADENVLLVGPAGTGKTYLCKQLADFLGLDFYFTNAVTQEHKLTGFVDANGMYHETQFYKAYKYGGLFLFDELDASDETVLTTFNMALDNGMMDFPTGRVDMHPDFKCVGAANTFGTGASMEYVGRTELDAATRDRFLPVTVDYDPEIEKSITDDLSLIEFVHTFRQACNEYGIHQVTSYRGLRRCAKFKDALGIKETIQSAIIKNLEKDDLMMMIDKFSNKVDEWSTTFCEIARGC